MNFFKKLIKRNEMGQTRRNKKQEEKEKNDRNQVNQPNEMFINGEMNFLM